MSLITPEEVAERGVVLPTGAEQAIIDETEAWLASRIGPLTDERTESFYVGVGTTTGKLSLRRYTDAVDVVDGGSAVDADHLRLIDEGSAIIRSYASPQRAWTGPYVDVTYEPNDALLIIAALHALVALSARAPGSVGSAGGDGEFDEEQIGSYRYRRAQSGVGSLAGASAVAAQRGAIVSSLMPRRDPALTLRAR